ncbi:Zn(II)2Cys6 transcription factor [Aspergillus neoniger CBS 115656]|uniref:Zn(II)2Cys6 transcription factor n=1 Tax=Aspergillus neoniger (strain CBS 115656) TaxID=1448310 RepID=A0A318Z7X1_ASPNB|nr:Zn(II)2Cys6 transcription factor [Aspergillus neoniger CBS 115656]PYH39760.1 Zn(II)2Cys6 transcription factor [Aspergillus neoniger CBS 115656]
MASKPPVRTPISCTFCRQKKLRCDRLQPCSSCTKRGLGCVYAHPASAAPRRNGPAQPRQLTQRIRQLEDLVVALQKGETPQTVENPVHLAHKSDSSPAASPETVANSFGSLRVDQTGMTYVSGAHWTALQDSIAELKECVELGPPYLPSRCDNGSALLRGVSPPGGIAEVLSHLPPRPTVDRLVSRFFSSMEPGVLVLHAPTFQKEYDQFWTHPQDVNLAWLSILFSIMCLAIHHHQLTEGHRPDPIGDTHGLRDDFRQQAAYCLIDNKYTAPTKYTIEALIFYAQTEYFRGEEFHHEVWLLMGMINRLAMRAGLHRDGSRYPELSCFAAEMRRRIWTLMSQLDALISFQLGLPRMIYDGLADTQPPHNLLDEDFSEDSTSLPPARPDTAFTPVAYLIAKSRLSRVFGLVIDHAASTAPIPSALIYQLDNQLNESYAAVPECLQFRSVSESVTASPRLVMLRYNLEILYQKTRCILHRKSLCEGHSDVRYAESRRICLDAAVRILQHQATIDGQVQAGGVLAQCRWFVTSLATNDFMLAAMVVCLELHNLEREGEQGGQAGMPRKDDLLFALQTSQRIWSQYKDESAEAWQAWQTTSIMLRKLNAPVLCSVSPLDSSNGGGNTNGHSTTSTETETDRFDPMLGITLDPQTEGSISVAEPKMLLSTEPEFDISRLPSELVNLWDFSGDMSWLAM